MNIKKTLMLVLLLILAALASAYNFGQNKVNGKLTDWSMIQTMHFDIYFPAGNDEFGKLAALMAEETYYLLRADLRFPVSSRIPIIFYGSKTEFQSTNIIYPILTEGVGGFTESLRNRVVIPFEGSYSKLEELLVHELVHAYVNALDDRITNAFNSLRPTGFPFWFSEGLPEFLSIGGEDNFNNMFVLDMVVNDRLPSLENIEGYYAYRLGESFLTYIANTYGREKVSEYFYAIRSMNSFQDATKKVFGLEFKELESRWRYQLKRDYFPTMNTHGVPKEDFEQRTDHTKDGSYFNFMPRFSPNGQRYVFFSNRGARYSIWIAGTQGLSPARKLITGESSGKLEEFYYFRSNIAWFSDNRRIAFSAKTANGDRIHIMDVEQRKIIESYALPQLSAIYEIDVSPIDGKIVIAGQMKMQSDLFLFDPESGELTRLTDDYYDDAQPRFSPDGRSVVFSSERSLDHNGQRKGFFANLTRDIYTYDLDSGQIHQHTFGEANSSFPLFDGSGEKLIYVSEKNRITNLMTIDIPSGKRAQMTEVLSGVFSGDVSQDGLYLVFSSYFNGAWDIYFGNNPFSNLEYTDYPEAKLSTGERDLLDHINLRDLDYFGKRPKQKPRRINPAPQYDSRRPFLGDIQEFSFTREDSLNLFRDFSYDDRPDAIVNPPQVKPYHTRFSLDSLWGGLAYSSAVGTIGYIELGLSDMMGNHGIGINAGIAGKLEKSNLLLSYLYLKRRADFGIGAFNLFDETIYRFSIPGPDDYLKYRERQTGAYFLTRYPFNRFLRADFEQLVYQREWSWDKWIWNSDATEGNWADLTNPEKSWVYSPAISLVHDNALYGSTGPLVGWRAYYTLRTSIADKKMEYLTNYLDIRSYTLFSKRYALAFRGIGGVTVGDSTQVFTIKGYNGVRAYEGDLNGQKKALINAELRFPFFEYIAMAFPLPITLGNIRGSVFADLGTVFDEAKDFRAFDNGKLKDLHLSYGWGPRINLGYVVLRLDIAWSSNLSKISKPAYYLSLSEDF
ncbi:MAG: BamA/TamA family outer membrane protein [Candidatus Cloacimonadaceae bacterium]|nr:BamA/TamA family outer membrane protein [Candidatus Cloacimonadaceae bacterium]